VVPFPRSVWEMRIPRPGGTGDRRFPGDERPSWATVGGKDVTMAAGSTHLTARASPDAVVRAPPPLGGQLRAAAGSASSDVVRASRPAAMTSLNERKRKMNTIAAKPVAKVSAPMAICWPTE